MFTTSPSDPVHALNALYQQVGGFLSSGVDIAVLIAIGVCMVIAIINPWAFKGLVKILFLAVVVALLFAHMAGKF